MADSAKNPALENGPRELRRFTGQPPETHRSAPAEARASTGSVQITTLDTTEFVDQPLGSCSGAQQIQRGRAPERDWAAFVALAIAVPEDASAERDDSPPQRRELLRRRCPPAPAHQATIHRVRTNSASRRHLPFGVNTQGRSRVRTRH